MPVHNSTVYNYNCPDKKISTVMLLGGHASSRELCLRPAGADPVHMDGREEQLEKHRWCGMQPAHSHVLNLCRLWSLRL